MKNNSYNFIKISLAIVYIWFGTLKVLGASPVTDFVKTTYPTFQESNFFIFLGLWEVAIGFLIMFRKTIKLGIVLMWLQLGGIFMGMILNPSLYFSGMNVFLLNTNGEFVIKNLVLTSAGYYLWKSK